MKSGRLQYLYSFITAVLLAIAATVFSPVSYGQSTAATITGTVLDQTGAAVPDVKIALTNINTGFRRQVETNDQGYFVLPQLQPGQYKLQAFREGFALVDIPDITLNASDRRDLQIKLKVSTASESVTISASAITVNTSDGTVSTVVDRQFVERLPLNGRSFQPLILLTPGVVQTPSNGGNVGQFSVNGQRSNSNYFQIDGVSANAGVVTFAGGGASTAIGQQMAGATPGVTAFGSTGSMVSVDALEEFKIQTSTYSAQFGRQPGAQVQMVTRSGTNTLHGTVFNYFRNDIFDARDYFNPKPDRQAPLRMNDFGGTLSGPILRNSTFFFFSYEGLRLREPDNDTWYVPSLQMRNSANPAFKELLNAFPLPTGPEVSPGWAPFVTPYSNPMTMNSYSLRLDHSIGSKVTLFGRYSETPSESMTRRLSVLTGDKDMSRSVTLGATATLTSRLSNEFRVNYTKSRGQSHRSLDDFGGAVPVDESVLLWGNTGPGTRMGTFTYSIPGATAASITAGDFVDLHQRQLNIVDNVAWAKGTHQLKFGVDYRRLAPTYGPFAYSGTVTVRTASYLTGTTAYVNNVNISSKREARPRFQNLSLYAQDTWKVTPRFTLDYGVRWELNPPPEEATGIVPPVIEGITGDLASGFDTTQARIDPNATSLYKTFYRAFAPRVGAAYQLNQDSGRETVLRGGFGVFYDLGSGQSLNGFTSTYPFSSLKNITTRTAFPLSAELSASNPLPQQPWTPTTMSNFFLVDSNLKLPYTLQWNVAVEQSLGNEQTISVSYVGSAGRKLLTRANLNGKRDSTETRPNPAFAALILATNGPTSDYHSMQVKYHRRLSHGLQALVNYTWSHSIDTVSDEINYGSLLRASSDFDARHNLSAALTYELPTLVDTGSMSEPFSKALKSVVNGWWIDSTLYAQSGAPFEVTAGSMTLDDGSYVTVRPDRVEGQPFWISDPGVAGGQRLNPAAFLLPEKNAEEEFLRQGTLGRNVIMTPFVWETAVSLGRRFSLNERWKLQFKADIFNPLNHPAFGSRDSSLASCAGTARTCTAMLNDRTLGVPDRTMADGLGMLAKQFQMGGNRSVQFSLKLSF
ncbi:MAG TPA: carboxypeptidase regulatory-like domain-containing protein [Terriglobales bacterium]|nr:carboxypeptidase regulatory-like domain-containing protein [Terriglobales bacterium]